MFFADFGFLYSHPHPEPLSFFNFFSEYWLVGPLQWPVGLFQQNFTFLDQTSSYVSDDCDRPKAKGLR